MTYPRNIIATDTETTTLKEGEETVHKPTLILGVGLYYRLSDTLDIESTDEIVYTDKQDFWDWIETKLIYNGETYIFAHNWSFDYPVLDGFRELQNRGWSLIAIVDQSPPVILRYKKPGYKITIIDTLNFFRQPLKSMGEAIGLHKIDIDINNYKQHELLPYCRRDTEIVGQAVIQLCRFLRDNQLSGFKHTVAALALSTFTNSFMHHSIFIDGNPERVAFTRESYFGGRTECFRVGHYKQRMYLIDVNSMFPFVMYNNDYPIKTFTTIKTATIEDLHIYVLKYCVTARVRVNTHIPCFPVKIDGRTCFPTGRFTTVLSSPEIEYALNNNLLESVDLVVLHYKARIFDRYVESLYTMRKRYKKDGNDSYQEFCKKLMNSLYGKFGQNGHVWEKTKLQPRGYPGTWEVHEIDNADSELTGTDKPGVSVTTDKTTKIRVVRYMEVNETVFEAIKETESRDSFPAIAAHVTAHARIYMQLMIDYLGREHVYYGDTDSLLIDDHAYQRIKDRLSPTALGAWSLDGEYDEITIHGLKDYEFGSKIKIKGINKKARMVKSGLYEQLQFSSLRGAINRGELDAPTIKSVRKELKRVYYKGTVDRNGIVVPFVLDED